MGVGCALLLAGCGCGSGPKFIYDGEWHGNRNLTLPDTPPDIAKSAGDVNLIIRDRRYELSEAGIPTTGEVVHADGHAVLHPKEVMMRPIPTDEKEKAKYPDIKITPQEDGSLLFDNPAASHLKPLGLNKVKD